MATEAMVEIGVPQMDAIWRRRDWKMEPSIPDRSLPVEDQILRASFIPRGDLASRMTVNDEFHHKVIAVNGAIRTLSVSLPEDDSLSGTVESLRLISDSMGQLNVDDPTTSVLARAIRHDVNNPITSAMMAAGLYSNPEARAGEAGASLRKMYRTAVARAQPAMDGWMHIISFFGGGTAVPLSGTDLMRKLSQVMPDDSLVAGSENKTILAQTRLPAGPLEVLFGNLRSNSDGVRQDREENGIELEEYRMPWGYYFVEPVPPSKKPLMVLRAWDTAGGFDSEIMPPGQLPTLGKTGRTNGTGFGLQLIDDMGAGFSGGIEVGNWSQDGVVRGACFSVIVPLMRQPNYQRESSR